MFGFTIWEEADTKMGTNNPGDTVDVWHWQATRTNPLGSTDDAVFDVERERPFSLAISDNAGHSKNGASLRYLLQTRMQVENKLFKIRRQAYQSSSK